MTGRGMDDEAGGFVDAHQVLVFEEDCERDLLGVHAGSGRFGLWGNRLDQVATPDRARGPLRAAVDHDRSISHGLLPAGAAEFRPFPRKPNVEARRGGIDRFGQLRFHRTRAKLDSRHAPRKGLPQGR